MNACATASSLHSLSPAVAPQEPYLLEVLNVSKGFPGVVALANVQLRVRPGTVLALMGENGAGKSTLMRSSRASISPTPANCASRAGR